MTPTASLCVDENTLVAWIENRLDEMARLAVESHLQSCASCREVVSSCDPTLPNEPVAITAPRRRGDRVGRYVIESQVGRGAMSIVYAANDPELHRTVALKLLRPLVDRPGDETRLAREAQAMARLADPNVLGVYEIGRFEGQVFLALEYVEGATLSDWSKPKRSLREILDVFVQAGRGLAAAHRARLVHRDFKPANVLIGRDGRVRVADFGLVAVDERPLPRENAEADHPLTLTQTGAILGTPAYMAPEQHEGGVADARSDQYAFCVSLWEAAFGERPFVGNSLPQLAAEVLRGEPRPPARWTSVPRWLRRVLRRGLARDPVARFPSMEALVVELERRRLTPLGALAGAAGVAMIVAMVVLGGRANRACRGAESKLAGVWGPAQRTAVERAFSATAAAGASDVWSRVSARLDDYARGWIRARTDACEATRVRHEQPEAIMSGRLACLDGQLDNLDALTSVLSHAGAKDLDSAVHGVDALPAPEECRASRVDRASPPASPKREAVQRALAKEKALTDLDRGTEALALGHTALDDAKQLGDEQLSTEASYRYGMAFLQTGAGKEATPLLYAALSGAEASHDDRLTARAASHLVLAALYANDLAAAQERSQLAEALLRRGDDLEARSTFLRGRLGLAMARGDFHAAADFGRQAIEIEEQRRGPDSPELTEKLIDFSQALSHVGQVKDAEAAARRAVDIATHAFGPGAAGTLQAAVQLADVYNGERRFTDALATLDGALKDAHPGPDDLASIQQLRGVMLSRLDRSREAIRTLEDALRIDVSNPGIRAVTRENLGLALLGAGRLDDARASLTSALADEEKLFGADQPMAFPVLSDLVEVEVRAGRPKLALAYAQRVAAMGKQMKEATAPALVMKVRAEAEAALGQLGPARSDLEQAEALFQHAGLTWKRASVERALADVVWKQGEKARAIELARRAVEVFSADEGSAREAREAKAWLATHTTG